VELPGIEPESALGTTCGFRQVPHAVFVSPLVVAYLAGRPHILRGRQQPVSHIVGLVYRGRQPGSVQDLPVAVDALQTQHHHIVGELPAIPLAIKKVLQGLAQPVERVLR
jgi:hypothetical protein